MQHIDGVWEALVLEGRPAERERGRKKERESGRNGRVCNAHLMALHTTITTLLL